MIEEPLFTTPPTKKDIASESPQDILWTGSCVKTKDTTVSYHSPLLITK